MIGYALVGLAIFALVFGVMRGMRAQSERDRAMLDKVRRAEVAETMDRLRASPMRCVTCGGTGDIAPYEDCPRCGGKGWKR